MFSPTVLDHAARPRNCGPLEGATHWGTAGVPGDGPFVTIELIVEGERVSRAAFQTYGCPAAIASGSVLAATVAGKQLSQLVEWTPEDLTKLLGGIPPGKEHCPELAIEALRRAVRAEQS